MELSSATPAWFVLISKLVYLTLLLEHVKELLARLPGFDEQSFEVDLGIPASEAAAGRRTPLSVRGVARALPVLGCVAPTAASSRQTGAMSGASASARRPTTASPRSSSASSCRRFAIAIGS